jgi:hypothetical protein
MGLSGLAIISGTFALIASAVMPHFPPSELRFPSEGLPAPFGFAKIMQPYFVPAAISQVVTGLIVLFLGWQFQKRKPWAAPALEGFTWLSMVAMTICGIFFLMNTNPRGGGEFRWAENVPQSARDFASAFMMVWWVMGIFMVIFFAACHLVMIKTLRSGEVRDAFKQPSS